MNIARLVHSTVEVVAVEEKSIDPENSELAAVAQDFSRIAREHRERNLLR